MLDTPKTRLFPYLIDEQTISQRVGVAVPPIRVISLAAFGIDTQAFITYLRPSFSVAGGINAERIAGVESAGATIAVAGAAIYGAKDPAAAAKTLRAKIKQLG